jgi:hypothetical protein
MDTSVADPGCLSWIPDPDFYPSRIPDSKTAAKEEGEIFFVYHFCSHKYHKIVEQVKKVFSNKKEL